MQKNSIMLSKGQRMSEVVLDNHGSSDSRRRRSRLGLLLLIAVVVALLCKPLPAQNAGGTASGSGGGGQASTAGSGGQATGQASSAQGDNAQATAQPETSVYDSGGNAQATDQTQMSADQIIAILQQQPGLRATVKAMVAQQTGVAPSTISDDALYNNIRQDANLRAQVTTNLNQLGYSTNATPQSNATSAVQMRRPLATPLSPIVVPDTPQAIQQPDPYGNLASLRDLYTQIPSAGGTLRRFGSEAFILGTGNANELPMDLPVGPDYVLGAGDNIVVNMWGGRSDRLSLTIDRQGQIALPEAGTITLDGLTIAQAQSAIQKSLSTQFQGEHVEISLGRLRTVRVYVVGDVQRPGAYDVSSMSTPLSALYAAGGPTSRGSLRILRQYRSTQMVRQIDLYDFLLHGVRSNSDRLLPGDTILVPPVGPQVTVEGMVHRPAIYELNGETTLNQVLDLAGGVLISASLKQIDVARIEAHERRTMLNLQLPGDADAVKKEIAGFQVQGGDDVVISQILPYNQQAVYLEGHVYRPGKYPYRDGMTINDLLKSYQDIMPEPADHAELVRLQPPDFRPETISFNLPDVLIGNDAIPLQPFDLIRIFSRYEIDSPTVTIDGEVLRPGGYPMSQGMTLAGLVRMAGGFTRSAYRDEADLSSYVVQNGQKVLVSHSIVEVEKALDGDKNADVVLKPGNVVSIRQLAGWQDIGASVTITGEVEHTGSYGIEQGERLSSVLKRAGGFRVDAYPAAAVLERVQVRELEEQTRQQMIQRIETTPVDLRPGTMSAQAATDMQQSLQQQRQQVLTMLRNRPSSGRMVINISANVSQWENTSADIELRAGDTLVIPKRPNFVMVSGQVYNPTAISYVTGRDVGWYLRKAGGATPYGNKRNIYVLRADGSVVPHGSIWTGNNIMNLRLRPGDSIFVPEKIIGSSQVWQNIMGTAQIMSAAALPIAILGGF
jgi:protein involved in polysaccharide export with SLBB domain